MNIRRKGWSYAPWLLVAALMAFVGCEEPKKLADEKKGAPMPGQPGKAVEGKKPPPPITLSVSHARFSDDGKWIVAVGGGISVWDATTEKVGKKNVPVQDFPGGSGQQHIPCICGHLVAVCKWEGDVDSEQFAMRVTMRDLATGKSQSTLTSKDSDFASSRVFSVKGGKEVVCVALSARFFDPVTGKLLHSIRLEYEEIFPKQFAVSPDGATLVTWGSMGNDQKYKYAFRVFDLKTGKLRKAIQVNDLDELSRFEITKDGKHVLLAGRLQPDFFLSVWNLESGKRVSKHYVPFSLDVIDNDRTKFASIGKKDIAIVSMTDFKEISSFAFQDVVPSSVAFSPDDSLIIVAGSRRWPDDSTFNPYKHVSPGETIEDRVIQIYNAKTGKLERTIAFPVWPIRP